MPSSLRFVIKWTTELMPQETADILAVLNSSFSVWGNRPVFDWKYVANPYGDSLHILVFDGSLPVGSVGFWRNDLDDQPAYQCVDLAVSPEYQRLGIARRMVALGIEQLSGAYLYTFPNDKSLSRPGFLKYGWETKRKVPITVHTVSGGLNPYRCQACIPEVFAKWRFAQHPIKQYYRYDYKGQIFLLNKQRGYLYAVGGRLETDLGLPQARPRFLLSYDFPSGRLKVPRHLGWLLENTSYRQFSDFVPGTRSDEW